MNTSKQIITVLSSFSTDKVVNDEGQTITIQEGGPARFITNALKDVGVNFELIAGEKIEVEILANQEGEFGRVVLEPKANLLDKTLNDWTIVSTVLDEWDLTDMELPDRLCVDLQGYVREGHDFGRKRVWENVNKLADKIYCLKGTAEEMRYIDSDFRESQKQRLLIMTNGEHATDVYYKGEHTRVPVQAVTGLTLTIGAGDTFLGYLVSQLSSGHEPIDAVKFASQKTAEFLKASYTKQS